MSFENIAIIFREEVCYKLPRKLSVLQKRLTCLEEFVIKKNAILFQEVRRISPRNIYVAEKKGYVSRRKSTLKRLRTGDGLERIADAKQFSFGVSEEE